MNINEVVAVDLTSHGRLALYRYEIGIGVPVHSSKIKGARLEMQLWDLMHVFGPEMVMGREPCFEGNDIRMPGKSADPK